MAAAIKMTVACLLACLLSELTDFPLLIDPISMLEVDAQ
jgi:hypothetical protein